jgi:TRAP-type mannitol/chloroaromatic compound transport system substrate-binding protein
MGARRVNQISVRSRHSFPIPNASGGARFGDPPPFEGEDRMSRKTLAASLGLAALLASALPAAAQSAANCAQRQQVISRLASTYGETRQSIGLGANNQVVEMFASLETGTWTITVTTPNGLTCLVASGQAYEALEETANAGDPA